MAAPIVAPQPQAGIEPVPVPHPQAVTQEELSWLLDARGELARLQEQVKDAESSILSRLESGVSVEPGARFASLKEHFRRSVAWREVCERLADRLLGNGKGTAYCEGIIRKTKPTRTASLALR